MKKTIILLVILITLLVGLASAQTKIDKYCQVLVGNKNYVLYTKKSQVIISFGQKKELFSFKDTSVLQQLKLVNNLTTETDALNYMSKLGWTLVNIHAITNVWEVIYFKKQFDTAELQEESSK